MADIQLKNESENKFHDISSEEYRTYVFVGEHGTNEVKITHPQFLAVSAGGHRLLDGEGVSHYVPKGWIQLSWKAKDGRPHFVK